MTYRHTQIGWLILVICAIIAVADVALVAFTLPKQMMRSPVGGLIILIGLAILFAVALLFGSLTVEVDDSHVRLRFGVGLVRKSFRLEEVANCQAVRNEWHWGWGIRAIPGGLLFNVSGLDAVELAMKNGKRFRIGTDQPQQLAEFIEAKLKRLV